MFRFSDGSVWSTNDHPGIFNLAEKRLVAQFISKKSAVPITELEILTRADQR